jgi:hemolysin activation/secretion protein
MRSGPVSITIPGSRKLQKALGEANRRQLQPAKQRKETQLKSHTHHGLGYVVVALACLGSSGSLLAQTAPTNAGRALESATPQQPQEIKKDANVLPPADAPRAAAGADGPTLLVKGFALTGNTIFSTDELLALVRPWVGKDAGTDQLLDAAEAIKNRYKDAGFFLTQVLVPAQEVPNGIVTLRVVEARIGDTHAEVTTQRVSPALVDGYMKLLPKGSAVTEQDVERPLLLLNDLPGVKVTSVLRPGAETGDADLLVKVVDEGKAFGGDGYVDNAGNESTGELRVGADLVANGLLGLGESWTLGGLASEHNGVDLIRAGVTMPVGYYGTKATTSVTYLHYNVLGEQFKALDADGDAVVGSLMVQHPVIRSRNFNLFAVGGGDVKELDDRTSGGLNHDERLLLIGHLGVTGDFRDERFGGSLNSFTLTANAGHNKIKTPDELRDDQEGGHKTNGTFEHLDGDYQRLQAVTDTTSVLLSMRGQIAFQNLDTSEKASLGGPRGVRAFAVGDGVGDDLFQGTVELRQRVPAWTLWNAPFVVSAFVDGGRVKSFHDPLADDTNNLRTLGGYGLGLNMTSRDNFQLRLDVAHRINKSDLPGSDNRMTRAWASLQKWF